MGKLFLGVVCLFIGTQMALAKNTIRLCNADRIKIYALAVDSPGMSKTNSLFGVINTGKTACRLPGKIQAWAVRKDGKAANIPLPQYENQSAASFSLDAKNLYAKDSLAVGSFQSNQSDQEQIVLEPTAGRQYIIANRLTWFSLSAGGETDLFERVEVRLSGLHKIFSIPYSGYQGGIAFSDFYENGKFIQNDGLLKKGGLERWPMLSSVGDEDCSYNTKSFKPVWDKKNLDSLEINLSKVAQCG